MTMPPIVIATRGSELALRQARMVQAVLEGTGAQVELKTFKTVGDKRRRPLTRSAPRDSHEEWTRAGRARWIGAFHLSGSPTIPGRDEVAPCFRAKIRASLV